MHIGRPAEGYRPLQPIEPQTFSDDGDRRRLSATAAKAFCSLAKTWSLTNIESAALLAVSSSTWDRIKKAPETFHTLNQDQLTRVSGLVGIYKGLHLLFADDMADRWVRLPNRGPLFGGKTPLDTAIEGGIPQILDVRRHVDALRGGL